MALADILLRYPFLASPVHLMQCYRGKAYLPTPKHLWALSQELMDLFNGPGGEWLLCNVPFRHGKALHIDTPIPTPDGWTTMEELRVGDKVFGDDGKPCEVVAVSPVWQGRPLYRVRTDDGDEILADAEHEWLVRLDNKWPVFKLKTTKQLSDRVARLAPMTVTAAALELPDADLPIDPYVLGVWLGDGGSRDSRITSADAEVIAGVAAVEGDVDWHESNGSKAITCRFGRSFRDGRPKDETLTARLRSLNLLTNKHIPGLYLRASKAQRLALLQGLIDTDGDVRPDGQVTFSNTKKPLAEGAKQLVASLGHKASLIEGRATLYGKDCGPYYRVSFYMADAARLPRKAQRCRTGIRAHRRYLKVEPAGFGSTRCIQVNSPSHMFLCGKTMLPTHNSEISSRGFPAWSLLWNPDQRIMICGHGEEFARDEYGAEVKQIIEQFGPELGIRLRADSKAKGQWKIDGHRGGMACFGPDSGGVGYPADLYLIDDLIRKLDQALSPGEMQKQFGFFKATVFSRLTNKSKLAITGTRWGRRDIFGRVMDMAKRSNKPYRHVRFPAFAVSRDIDPATGLDPLGRKVGEPLWPEQVSVEQLNMAKKEFGPYFAAWYQQAPVEEEGSVFQPSGWPRYTELDHAFRLHLRPDRLVMRADVSLLVAVDWAYSEKKKADRTAIVVCGLLPDGGLLVLDCVCGRFSVEEGPKQLAAVCRRVHPALVAMEGHEAMTLECRKYPEIPEPRQLRHQSKAKIVRAVQAIDMGTAGKIYLPSSEAPWLDDFVDEIGDFTGIDDDHDDRVDALAWACHVARQLRGAGSSCEEPAVLISAPDRGGIYA